jgi:AAA15 family ATPase/GTPase
LGEGARAYADLGERRPIPLAMIGEGFSKLLTILTATILGEASIMLIDEIENGFHYSVLPDVWRAIVAAASGRSVQIFVTTHSLECIEAAVEGSQDHEGTLAFYRLERRQNGIEVVAGADDRLRSAVKVGFELR